MASQQRIYNGPFRYDIHIFRKRRKYGRWSVVDGISSLLLALKRSTCTKDGIPCRKHEGIIERKDGTTEWTGLDWTGVLQIMHARGTDYGTVQNSATNLMGDRK